MPAFDPDANDTLLYEINQSLEFLLLDNKTGEITLNSNLNTNVPISAPMSFQVSGMGKCSFIWSRICFFFIMFSYLYKKVRPSVRPYVRP